MAAIFQNGHHSEYVTLQNVTSMMHLCKLHDCYVKIYVNNHTDSKFCIILCIYIILICFLMVSKQYEQFSIVFMFQNSATSPGRTQDTISSTLPPPTYHLWFARVCLFIATTRPRKAFRPNCNSMTVQYVQLHIPKTMSYSFDLVRIKSADKDT